MPRGDGTGPMGRGPEECLPHPQKLHDKTGILNENSHRGPHGRNDKATVATNIALCANDGSKS